MRCSTRSAIRLCSSAPSTAIPIARPSWRAVLLMPEARPPCAGGSTPRWAKVTSGLASPMPRADDDRARPARPATTTARRARHQQRARPRVSAMPTASAPRSGTRSLSRPAASETAKATTASGASHGRPRRRVPAPHVEHEQRQVHERAERPGRQRRDDDRGAEEGAVAEQLQVEHRRAPPVARRRRRRRGRRRPPRRARAPGGARPAERVAPQHREDDQEEAGRERRDAGPVDRLGVGVARLADVSHGEGDRGQGRARPPSTKIACHPNGSTSTPPTSGPAANAEADDRAPDPDRPPALGALELLGEQRQGAREDDRGAQPLERPHGDQHRPPTARARTAKRQR